MNDEFEKQPTGELTDGDLEQVAGGMQINSSLSIKAKTADPSSFVIKADGKG